MQQKNNLLGFGFQLGSIALFIGMDVFIKILVVDYPLVEVIFYRSAMGLPLLFIYLKFMGHMSDLRITRPWLHVWRAILGLVVMYCIFSAYKYLPLAEASAIVYTAPIMITILSVVFLGEKIYAHRTFALIIGFIGALVIVRPSVDFNWDYLYPLGAALGFSIVTIVAHNLTKTDHPISISVSFSVSIALVTGAITLWLGFTPIMDIYILLYAFLVGNLGTVAQICNMYAIRACNASFYAVTKYIGLFGTALAGLLVFGEPLSTHLILGMGIIAFAGIYISWREHVRNKKDRMRTQLRE